ncbi:MAG TPA: hypothetical protein VJT73_10120, partial [Polyangiaceae bacterium]|nr:hypothetical protein [Polyangiaceae bacterium]
MSAAAPKFIAPHTIRLLMAGPTSEPASLLVLDALGQAVVKVDLATGRRTIVSGGTVGVGVGQMFRYPTDMVLDADTDTDTLKRIYVVDR